MIRWLSAWLRKPAKRRACELPSAEERESKSSLYRTAFEQMNAFDPLDWKPDNRLVEVKPDWRDYMNAAYTPTKPTASDAARTLSRHGHAKARAKIRAKADEMNAAMGRPKAVWP